MATSHTTAVCEIVAARPSNTACPTVPRIATMNAAIIVFEWPGSRPCNAPSRIALGMKSQALPCCRRVENSVMTPRSIELNREPRIYSPRVYLC